MGLVDHLIQFGDYLGLDLGQLPRSTAESFRRLEELDVIFTHAGIVTENPRTRLQKKVWSEEKEPAKHVPKKLVGADGFDPAHRGQAGGRLHCGNPLASDR